MLTDDLKLGGESISGRTPNLFSSLFCGCCLAVQFMAEPASSTIVVSASTNASPLPKNPDSQSTAIRFFNARMEKLSTTVERVLKYRIAATLRTLPVSTTQRLSSDPLIILDQSAGTFLVEARPPNQAKRRDILMSRETIRSVFKISSAVGIAQLVAKDDRWVQDYLLYCRATRSGTQLPDPFDLAGIVDPFQIAGILDEQTAVVESVLLFMIAHELGHIDAQHITSTPEHEKAADEFAFNVLVVQKETPAAPSLLFNSWILLMEGVAHPVKNGTHPADHLRLQQFSKYVIATKAKWDFDSASKEAMVKLSKADYNNSRQLAKHPEQFFLNLSLRAGTIKAQQLSLNGEAR